MKERWKRIDGLEGRYEVSNFGRVRSLFHNRSRLRKAPLIMKPGIVRGYHQYLFRLNNKSIQHKVHHLVLVAFVGPRPGAEFETRHLDGSKDNNRFDNLCWGTMLENAADKARHGSCKGERNGRAKLTRQKVIDIRRRHSSGDGSFNSLAREYHVSKAIICFVITRRTWSHVP